MAYKNSLSSRPKGARYKADEPEPEPQPESLAFGARAALRKARLRRKNGSEDLRVQTAAKRARARKKSQEDVLFGKEYN